MSLRYGNGNAEWNTLAKMDWISLTYWISLKSMLIVFGRPTSAHQAVVKLKEIKILISEQALAKSVLISFLVLATY